MRREGVGDWCEFGSEVGEEVDDVVRLRWGGVGGGIRIKRRIDGRLLPGAAEFGAAGGFLGGDVEGFASAGADSLPIVSDGAEFVFLFIRCGVGFCVGGFFGTLVGALGKFKALFLDLEFLVGEVLAVQIHFHFVGAIICALGEIGEALEGEELGGGVVTGIDEVTRGFDNGIVDFFGGGGSFGGGYRFEFGEG